MSAFTAPAIGCIPLVGAVSDRYGRKPALTAGLAVFGLAGVAVTLTTDFRAALAFRLLQGVGYTGIGPVLITATGDLFEGPAEATAQGLRFTTVGVSLAAFPLVSGALVAVASLASAAATTQTGRLTAAFGVRPPLVGALLVGGGPDAAADG